MPVTVVTRDPDARTLTLVAEFAAPIDRLWQVYADPRQLEQIWGPPTHPATFVDHDLSAGGRMRYFMTGPEGEKYPGVWFVRHVEMPQYFTYDDAFADEHFMVDDTLPLSANRVEFAQIPGGTRVSYISSFVSVDEMQQAIAMGAIEGATAAINQIDALVADS